MLLNKAKLFEAVTQDSYLLQVDQDHPIHTASWDGSDEVSHYVFHYLQRSELHFNIELCCVWFLLVFRRKDLYEAKPKVRCVQNFAQNLMLYP